MFTKIKLTDFADSKDNISNAINKATIGSIDKWINSNYEVSSLIYVYDNEKGIYKVSSKGNVLVTNTWLKSLTNDDFEWDVVKGDFCCYRCKSLISLEGAPQKVGGNFDCSSCKSLISLKGSPEEVGGDFYCSCCHSLYTLEGSPQKVRGDFYSRYTPIVNLKGINKIYRDIYVDGCICLQSIEDVPATFHNNIFCRQCQFLKVRYIPSYTVITKL